MNVIMILCDTLRRDHCGPYHLGRPVNEVVSAEQPDWVVPTPNMDRLARRGTRFNHAWCGSTPCMPARRDIYTGIYEFLRRGWGPLEDGDCDLPRAVSGPANQSVTWLTDQGYSVSGLITDHFHLWEQGSGNYHMGYTGFDFVRGAEGDNWHTDPTPFACPEAHRYAKLERHYRNVHHIRRDESDWFAPQVLKRACDWLKRNHEHEDFYLHLDCFTPAHEPWDPPEALVKQFDPRGYDVEGVAHVGPYAPWRDHLDDSQLRALQARYAAGVVLFDRWLGRLLDTLDELDLWSNTMVILTSDHGTYNGDHGRMGKLQTHEHAAVGHIPLIIAHPEAGHGEERDHLVQLVDLYPTTLSAVGRLPPDGGDGIDLLPVIEDATAETRDYALAGQFGKSVSLIGRDWVLHQSPVAENQPLYWYGVHGAHFIRVPLGPVEVDERGQARRRVEDYPSWDAPTWLSDKRADPNELVNLAEREPGQLQRMQDALREVLIEARAPGEQLERLGLGLG